MLTTPFEAIGTVEGAGTTARPNYYQFTDNTPIAGRNYYRLKQLDRDGHFEYFPVVTVLVRNAGTISKMSLFPNPTSNNQVVIALPDFGSPKLSATIVSLDGKPVWSGTTAHVGTDPLQWRVNLPDGLPAGIYIVSVDAGGELLHQKLVVQGSR